MLTLTKVTKGGRAFREETDNVYRSYLCIRSDLPLSALPRRIIPGDDEESLALEASASRQAVFLFPRDAGSNAIDKPPRNSK